LLGMVSATMKESWIGSAIIPLRTKVHHDLLGHVAVLAHEAQTSAGAECGGDALMLGLNLPNQLPGLAICSLTANLVGDGSGGSTGRRSQPPSRACSRGAEPFYWRRLCVIPRHQYRGRSPRSPLLKTAVPSSPPCLPILVSRMRPSG